MWKLFGSMSARSASTALLVIALAGCNTSNEAPKPYEGNRTQEARPKTKEVRGTGYALAVPRSWSKLKAQEVRELKIKNADLAVADRPRGCTSEVALIRPAQPAAVQPAAAVVPDDVVPANADPACALQGHRQVVFVRRAANVPAVPTSSAEQQVRQVFETFGPELRYVTRPRVDLDQIEGAHVIARGRNNAGQQVRMDGVVAYHIGSLYFVFMMQVGDDARAQDKAVSTVLRSWEWR